MRGLFAVAAAIFLCSLSHLAQAAQNNAISISGSGTHIDRGVSYSNLPFLSATGGTAPYTFSVSPTSALPVGITVNSDGSLSGATCGSNGSFSGITATATDANGDFNSASVTIIVNRAPAGGCTLTFDQSTLPDGTTNTAYSQTLTVSGAIGTVTYSVTSGSFPTGLSLNSSTGTISGTPTTAGSYTFTILASDTSSNTGTQTFTIVITAPTITLSPTTLPNGMQGDAYSQTVSASGGTAPYAYSISSGSLPNGLLLNSSTGVINGTPTGSGLSTFTVTATDTNGNTGSRSYTVNIGTNSLTVNPATLPNGTQNVAYSQTVSASGGTGTYTFAVSSGALPTGLSLNVSTGAISGTPTGSGSSTFTIQATDSIDNFGTRSYTINIGTALLTVNPAALPNGTQSVAYSQTVSASGGTGPYTFAVTAGSLPTGLSLNTSTGVISGTPSGSGASTFTIQATDSVNNTGSRSYTVNIGTNSLTVNPSTLPNGTQGVAYSQTVSASGGTGPYTFAITAGSLPTGLALNTSTGAISGTPSGSGASTFTIQATDSVNNTGSRSYTVNIGSSSLTVNPATLPNGTLGVAYSQTISVTGGTAPYTFSVTSGALPAGLSLNSGTGAISGTPTASGPSTFTVQAVDTNGNIGSRSYTVNIGSSSLTVNPVSLPNGTQGTAYSQTVSASGGTAPYSFAISSGTLPAGLSLDTTTGLISGTPLSAGSSAFIVQAIDSIGNVGSRSYTINIGANTLTVNPGTLPNGTQGVAYSQTVSASGGTAPYTFAVSSGSLPAGLALDTNSGVISGTPTIGGSSTFTTQATDAVNNVATRTYTVNIGTNSLTVNPATLPNGIQGTAYNQTVSATGGTGPYTFAVTSGALPTGLSLNSATGEVYGTPTANGSSTFTIGGSDSVGNVGSRSYTVGISSSSLAVNPASLPNGTQGTAYSQTVSASGGTAPYTFAVSAGALPVGLSLNASTGLISGTPASSGSYSFTIQATDTTSNTATRAYTVLIGNNILTLAPGTLPNGTQNTAYNQTVSASGGSGPYTFALSAGSLPTGLSLSSSGAIAGTPTGSGSSSFTVQATDSVGNTGSQAYTVNIGTVSLTVNPSSLPAGTRNVAYSQTVSATGGTGSYTFTISTGALPTGLSLSSAGVISGTPTGSGSSSFTVQALDTLGNVGTRAYTVNIGTVSLTINPATLPAAVSGKLYSQTVVASGGTPPYIYSITAGALPPGLTLNGATGAIGGTPTTLGSATFTIQARDINGNIGTRAYTLVNRPDPALDPEVRGLIAAQVATAQRFAFAQVSNIKRHLESLHDQFTPCSFNFGIAPPIEPPMQPYSVPGYANPNQLYSPNGQYGTASRYVAPPPPQQFHRPGERDCAADWMSATAFWTSGAVQFGSMTPTGLSSNNRFNSAGLTAGVDLRMTDRLIVGASFGYGADRTDVGQNSSRSDATSLSASLYASLKLMEPLYLDAAIGYGTLGYDNRRWASGDSTIVSGKRNGSYWFGALAATLEMRRGQFKFAPYVRTDFMSASLDGYAEQGTSAQLLTYDTMKVNAVSGAVGLRGSIDIPASFGILSPMARVEYRQTGQGAYDQAMYYSDLGAALGSTLSQPSASNSMTSGAVGLRAHAPGGLMAEVEYGVSGGSAALIAQSIRAALRLPF